MGLLNSYKSSKKPAKVNNELTSFVLKYLIDQFDMFLGDK